MIDVAAVPNRFKNAIAEAEYQDVLDGLFSKVMVDTENLAFREYLAYLAVQGFGRCQIIAKRFFENNAPPMSIFFTR